MEKLESEFKLFFPDLLSRQHFTEHSLEEHPHRLRVSVGHRLRPELQPPLGRKNKDTPPPQQEPKTGQGSPLLLTLKSQRVFDPPVKYCASSFPGEILAPPPPSGVFT